MQLYPAKCPDCGADIKIPEGSTSLVCEFCGGNILVTDLLGSTSVMHNCMTLAYSAMENGNYKDGYDHFNRAIEIDLKNPNAWFGKAVCLGMTGRLADNTFEKMIDLFECAFNNAPADKLQNLKKNAAAEIVKVVRKNTERIHLAAELLTLSMDDDFSSKFSNEFTKLKETVTKTVQKAHEYDASNKEVLALLDEIKSGKFFESEKKSEEMKKENDILIDFKSASDELNSIPPINTDPAPVNQIGNNKKGGCSLVLLIIILVISTLGFFLVY